MEKLDVRDGLEENNKVGGVGEVQEPPRIEPLMTEPDHLQQAEMLSVGLNPDFAATVNRLHANWLNDVGKVGLKVTLRISSEAQ